MMDFFFVLKAPLIGLIAAIPVGPVAVMAVQKSISDGRKPGLSCGLGGTFVDTICATIAVFAISSLGDLIDRNAHLISLVGGILIIFLGIMMILSKIKENKEARRSHSYDPYNFIKAVAMGLGNPACPAVMLALFAGFNMDLSDQNALIHVLTVLGVAAGSATYWYFITRLIAHVGARFNMRVLLWINRIAGVAICIFGAVLLLKSF
ncbi:MAG: LysE family transporter [Bacteroidales bacterium]|nr:LysE family transporter [Bacteroidales bacterium]